MIERILPAPVRSAYALDDLGDATLYPGEAELVAAAVPKRRDEFTTVRHCARTALADLGVPPGPILRGERGAPIWPRGIVGSLTHCAGYRAAAVARDTDVRGIGVDAEVHGPLPDGVLDLVSLPEERDHLAALSTKHPQTRWERVLFSAKESVYKVWFPRTGEWLGFKEASLTFAPDTGEFTARLLRPGPFDTLAGRYLVAEGIVLTAIVLKRPAQT
ncbi:4'-phosphopantetheinyl transferase family protein [Couchioplanes caeruleus]|uniref:4'-phosphopantetheinyl transferase n=2 Tax=Couchioplanes caeruleus TaxID=56438 RepID=A0A1K0FH39_9ACTN|nr:4'-phosphopantetheinyl transferase superfamily protein [Couchioplanes caeruleus]OJF12159.1 4'-phosphopantetheinyl transferase [Couchioplanes caeruleus subsp. caeruleus]ROP33076.1 4'-phosphopantetheinyl transferase EntD [Couchioplanes caeruleus]